MRRVKACEVASGRAELGLSRAGAGPEDAEEQGRTLRMDLAVLRAAVWPSGLAAVGTGLLCRGLAPGGYWPVAFALGGQPAPAAAARWLPPPRRAGTRRPGACESGEDRAARR